MPKRKGGPSDSDGNDVSARDAVVGAFRRDWAALCERYVAILGEFGCSTRPTGDDFRLCFVGSGGSYGLDCAYFAKDFDAARGDDWDDAPYQYNAEPPCEDSTELVRCAFDSDYAAPADVLYDRAPSVDAINSGAVAWLIPSWDARDDLPAIPAGTTFAEFRRLIRAAGGTIFLEQSAGGGDA